MRSALAASDAGIPIRIKLFKFSIDWGYANGT
jgi:hypothetical protein